MFPRLFFLPVTEMAVNNADKGGGQSLAHFCQSP